METILEAKNILKVYENGVIANRGVSVAVEENTIHAIVGENGAGKTTLMKIIFGIEQSQEGEIIFKGEKVQIRSPHDAIRKGIGMVHQHLMLAPDLSVAENMILGKEPLRARLFLDTDRAVEITRQVSEQYGLKVPPDKKIKDLPIGVRQRVEILKALFRNAELLILDEPTSVLTLQETEVLFNTLKDLKEQGKTIIFISHKLKEVKQIAFLHLYRSVSRYCVFAISPLLTMREFWFSTSFPSMLEPARSSVWPVWWVTARPS
ncbi:Vitamin B12 import ATP-binding protein BtuD [subsurface metagenome]